jgi:hypothetical protein
MVSPMAGEETGVYSIVPPERGLSFEGFSFARGVVSPRSSVG